MVIIESALRLLGGALMLEINSMSTSALALGIGLIVVFVQLHAAYRRGGWEAVKIELRSDAWKGAAAAIGLWFVLFCGFFVAAVYQDHDGLKGALNRKAKALTGAQSSLNSASADCDRKTSGLRQDVAVKQAIDETLQRQNRDQQNTINGCLTQALGFLKPLEFKETILTLDNPKQDNAAMTGVRWIILTNQTLTPLRMNAHCDLSVSSMDISVIGSSALGGTFSERLSTTDFRLHVSTPAWSPSSPLLITAVVFDKNITCQFNPER